MLDWGFTRLMCEWCVYYCTTSEGTVLIAVHIDNILSVASSKEENAHFKCQLHSKWTISDLGDVKFALSIGISHDQSTCSIALNQMALIGHVISQFKQHDAHAVPTPMDKSITLHQPPLSEQVSHAADELLAHLPYHSLVGCLMYITLSTCPDIAYTISCLSCFLDCYHVEHWNAAVHVVHYLKGTPTLPLILGGDSIQLIGFMDSDYTNDLDSHKSVGSYCFTLGSNMASWSLCKQ